RLGIAEHDADLLAKLVDEDETAFRFRDRAGELPQRLRHEPRLQPHLRVAHFAFDFRLRHERRDRVDDDDVDAVRSNEHLDDLERLLAVVRLRDEEAIEILAKLLFDLADGDVDSLEAFAVLPVVSFDGGHARAPVTRGEVTALFMARGAPPPLARAAALEDSLLARAAGAQAQLF